MPPNRCNRCFSDAVDARAMAHWAHGGGFSVDGSVRIEATDRATTQRTRRGPPLWDATDAEHDPAADPLRQCAPAFEFAQRIAS